MDIEREYGREPGWFDGLDREVRARLLAHWQIRHEPPAPAKATDRPRQPDRVVGKAPKHGRQP